jgi:hypothetical protein
MPPRIAVWRVQYRVVEERVRHRGLTSTFGGWRVVILRAFLARE